MKPRGNELQAPLFSWNQDRDLVYTWTHGRMPGLLVRNVIGKKDAEVFPKKLANAMVALKARVLRTGKRLCQAVSLEVAAGEERQFQICCWPFRTRDGTLSGLSGIAMGAAGPPANGSLRPMREEIEDAAAQRERLRLAGDLHDGLLQHLVATDYHLQALNMKVRLRARDRQEISASRKILNHMKEKVRESIRELHGVPGKSADLLRQLRQSIQAMVHWPKRAVTLSHTGRARKVAPVVVQQLVLLFQEAVGNAIKHGLARRVSVRVGYRKDGLYVSINDDGKGFDPAHIAGAATGHFGVLGMERRVRWLGGELSIESARDQGTHIVLSIPWGRISDCPM